MIRPAPMMQTARRLAAVALVAAALAARSARAQDAPLSPGAPRFRLFPEAVPPPSPKDPGGAPAPKREKRFWMAAGELLGLEVMSWGFNRYVMDQGYAHISWETVRNNLQAGFAFDDDKFTTNQIGH